MQMEEEEKMGQKMNGLEKDPHTFFSMADVAKSDLAFSIMT